jgi:hypothetical protein
MKNCNAIAVLFSSFLTQTAFTANTLTPFEQNKEIERGQLLSIPADYCCVAPVLPLQFLNFKGLPAQAKVLLSWNIMTSKDVGYFEIERSLDNSMYDKVGTVTTAVKLNEEQQFGYADNINGISNDVIYYRLKVTGKEGEIKYSNILVVRQHLIKTPVTVVTDPAKDYVAVKFFTKKKSIVTIKLIDNSGKTVLLQKQKAGKGNNVLQLSELGKYNNGIYSLQVMVSDEVVTYKLIIER